MFERKRGKGVGWGSCWVKLSGRGWHVKSARTHTYTTTIRINVCGAGRARPVDSGAVCVCVEQNLQGAKTRSPKRVVVVVVVVRRRVSSVHFGTLGKLGYYSLSLSIRSLTAIARLSPRNAGARRCERERIHPSKKLILARHFLFFYYVFYFFIIMTYSLMCTTTTTTCFMADSTREALLLLAMVLCVKIFKGFYYMYKSYIFI